MLISLIYFWHERKRKLATYFSHNKWSSVVKTFNNTRLVVKSENSAFRSFRRKRHRYTIECFLRCFQRSAHPAHLLGQVPVRASPRHAGVCRLVLCKRMGKRIFSRSTTVYLTFMVAKQFLKHCWLSGHQSTVDIDLERSGPLSW